MAPKKKPTTRSPKPTHLERRHSPDAAAQPQKPVEADLTSNEFSSDPPDLTEGAALGEGEGATARERDLRDLWEHTLHRDHEVADALVVIAEHSAGVATTGPLCPAIATVLVFVARNAGKREVAP